MSPARRTLCWIYAIIAVIALIGTWGNNIAYFNHGFIGANLAFWSDTLANPASRSITVDLLFLSLAVMVWMVLEARRLGLRWVWLYVLFGLFVAISVSVPLFLLNRERALADQDQDSGPGHLSAADSIGLIAVAVGSIGYTAFTLFGT